MSTPTSARIDEITRLLSTVNDPELPGINIIDLGILRSVQFHGEQVIVEITTTYSGCPALKVIEDDIRNVLAKAGFETLEIKTVLSPAWSTDFITPEACEKLRALGIAPPNRSGLAILQNGLRCPQCNSDQTRCVSEFGSTPCKALWKCDACGQPFEHFKAH